ncbi:MAG TPA: lysine transporter LysE [Oceanospirillaceae bacterium]|nr:lysine transporter LysE [Oceanospirillaceae bacterium]
MLGTQDLWLFIVSGIALNLVPGQDFIFIASRSTSQGVRAGIVASLGVGAGTLVHIFAAAFGVSAILAASSTAYTVIKVLGGLYLLYLGASLLLRRKEAPASPSRVIQAPLKNIFYQGFLTNALNPKVALFFIAFVPQFIAPDATNIAFSFLVLGFIFSFNGMLWCFIVAWFSANIGTKFRQQTQLTDWATKFAGGLFTYFGISLLMSSNH